MQTIEFKGHVYPAFQASGFAARFAFPFAQEVCKGVGFDVGCNREEWKFPGAIAVDPVIDGRYDASFLPPSVVIDGVEVDTREVDFIFSSHCAEHLPHWVQTLDYWHVRLKKGGALFLYLPDHSQVYWRGHHNRKHVHHFTPEILSTYFLDQPEMWENVWVSNVDLNNSFMVISKKK